MTPLAWFRFQVTGMEFLRCLALLFLSLSVLFVIGHAEDLDGDGYDDETGAWVGGSMDSDGDGITDDDEIYIYFTDPYLWDTDGDWESDGDEIAN